MHVWYLIRSPVANSCWLWSLCYADLPSPNTALQTWTRAQYPCCIALSTLPLSTFFNLTCKNHVKATKRVILPPAPQPLFRDVQITFIEYPGIHLDWPISLSWHAVELAHILLACLWIRQISYNPTTQEAIEEVIDFINWQNCWLFLIKAHWAHFFPIG